MSELQEIKISWGMIEIFYGNIGALFSENLNPLQLPTRVFIYLILLFIYLFLCVYRAVLRMFIKCYTYTHNTAAGLLFCRTVL